MNTGGLNIGGLITGSALGPIAGSILTPIAPGTVQAVVDSPLDIRHVFGAQVG